MCSELDNLFYVYDIASQLRCSGLIGTRKYFFKTYQNCFVGRDFVLWMMNSFSISREKAIALGKLMIKKKIFHHVVRQHDFEDRYLFYRLHDDEDSNRLLNDLSFSISDSSNTPVLLSGQVLCLLLSIAKFHRGDRKQILSSRQYVEFQIQISFLTLIKLGELKEEEKIPFWVNIFNTLALHSRIMLGNSFPSLENHEEFMSHYQYRIGKEKWCLHDIYHGILRGNRIDSAEKIALMEESDRRILHVCTKLDPRIHFLLNYQASSCPKIQILTSDTLEFDMEKAVSTYLNHEVAITKDEVIIPRYFFQFRKDFGKEAMNTLIFVDRYLQDKLDSEASLKVKAKHFDWTCPDITALC